jgi:hypothetical protein
VNDRSSFHWHRQTNFDLYAQELINLHRCSLALEEQYNNSNRELPVDATVTAASNSSCNVRHLGVGVFVQSNTLGIDADSRLHPQTNTTPEIRYFAKLCIETVVSQTSLVLGTGQPGIGKTRGVLAYTLQELLHRGEAVMRVGYKQDCLYLFLPFTDLNGTITESGVVLPQIGAGQTWHMSERHLLSLTHRNMLITAAMQIAVSLRTPGTIKIITFFFAQ